VTRHQESFMKSFPVLCLSLCTAAGLWGCGSNSSGPAQDGLARRDGLPDGAVKDGAPRSETWIDPDLGPLPPSQLQVVLNKFLMPKSATEYAYNYDGTGAKNQLGAIASVMNNMQLQGFDFQTNVDTRVNGGTFLMLLDVLAKALTEDPAMKAQALLGQDLDSPENPADNFSGTEPLGVKAGSPRYMILDGKITAGKLLAGPGTLIAPVPAGATPETVTLHETRIEAEVSAAGMTNGYL